MNRRGFLGSILALGAAPAIVRADSLMRIVPLDTSVLFGAYDVVIDAGPVYGNQLLTVEEMVREMRHIMISLGMWRDGR